MSILIISYDISNNKLRTKFSKFLSKFGGRLQYSVFEIRNSDRILQNIKAKLDSYYMKQFDQSDSVIIFELSNTCKRTNYGYARNDENDIIFV